MLNGINPFHMSTFRDCSLFLELVFFFFRAFFDNDLKNGAEKVDR